MESLLPLTRRTPALSVKPLNLFPPASENCSGAELLLLWFSSETTVERGGMSVYAEPIVSAGLIPESHHERQASAC